MGFGAVYALPMRSRAHTIGALNLFHRDPDTVSEATLRVGQASADIATIAILQQRTVKDSHELSQQHQLALNSRVTIEQAKGLISGRLHLDMTAAFTLMRNHARHTNQRLSDVAHALVTGEFAIDEVHRLGATRLSADPCAAGSRTGTGSGSTAGFMGYWE